MMKTSLFLTATTLLLIALSFPGVVSDQDDREAIYVGAGFDHELNEECAEAIGKHECLVTIPTYFVLSSCDQLAGEVAVGIGGVRFCDVPRGSTVTLTVDDAGVAVPEAYVACRGDDHWVDDHSTEIVFFAYLEGSLTVTVPEVCFPMTDLLLFHIAGTATTGTAYLEFEG